MKRMLIIWAGIICFLSFIFLSFPRTSFANLLLNSSFEATTSGVPNFWTKNVSTVTFSSSATAKSGTMSASIIKSNTGSIYAYQDVDIEPNTYYSLSGYAVKNSPNFNWVVLRISWRDASSELSKTDSSQLTSDSTDFQFLKIDSVQAPSASLKARVELVGNITLANPLNPILFDDVDFSQVSVPDQPTSTPAPTSVPTATKVPSPTPVLTATAVLTQVVSTTPQASDSSFLLEEELSEDEDENVLGETDQKKKDSLFTKGISEKKERSGILPIVLMSIGIILMATSGIRTFLQYRKRKLGNE